MSTPEDIELAKQANAAVIARESTATEMTFDEPMVVEGEVPFVPVTEAEGAQPADSFTGDASPFNQSWVDFRIRQVTGPDPVDPGPMSQEPEPFSPEPEPSEMMSINNPTYAFDPKYDTAADLTDDPGPSFISTEESAFGGEVAPAPDTVAKGNESADKMKAAKAIAIIKLTKEGFDALTPEEQDGRVNEIINAQEVLEGGGEREVETTEGLTPAAIGTGERAEVPAAQSMSAKAPVSPQQRLAQLAVEKQQLALDSVNQEIISTAKATARARVVEEESAVDREAKTTESDKAFDDLKTAMANVGDFKVDRDRYWNSKTTGQKIAVALSLMLSAYAHAKSGRGGVDPALKMMMGAVDKDVADQRLEYNSRVAGLGRKQSLYGLFRQQGLDDIQAEKASLMKEYHTLRMDLGRQELKTKSQMAKIHLQEAQQKLLMAEKGLLNGYGPKTFADSMRWLEHQTKKADKLQLRTSNVVRGGRRLVARNAQEATRADKIEAKAVKGVKAFQDMRNLINQMQASDLYNPWSKLRKQIDTQRAIMFLTYKDVVSPGTIMSDPDALRVAKIDKDPTDISITNFTDVLGYTTFALTALDQFEASLKSHRDDDLLGIFPNYPTPKRIDKRTIYNTGPVKPRGGR